MYNPSCSSTRRASTSSASDPPGVAGAPPLPLPPAAEIASAFLRRSSSAASGTSGWNLPRGWLTVAEERFSVKIAERDAAFPCASAAILPKPDAFGCGTAAAGSETYLQPPPRPLRRRRRRRRRKSRPLGRMERHSFKGDGTALFLNKIACLSLRSYLCGRRCLRDHVGVRDGRGGRGCRSTARKGMVLTREGHQKHK